MCETTAALFDASAGEADSWVLNGPPLAGCQQDACEVALICDTGHDPAASATVGASTAPPTASADAKPNAVQMALARFRRLSSLSMLSYRLRARVQAIRSPGLDVRTMQLTLGAYDERLDTSSGGLHRTFSIRPGDPQGTSRREPRATAVFPR